MLNSCIIRKMFTIKWQTRFLLLLLGSIIVLLYFLPSNEIPKRNNNDLVNLRELLLASIEVASMGGMQIAKVFENDSMNQQSKGKTLEGKNDPVTDADYKSHCIMYHSLAQTFPLINIISEEKPPENVCNEFRSNTNKLNLHPSVALGTHILHDEFVSSTDVVIWIDPLDATQEFTEKLTDYVTTMVCIAVNGKPVIGVIHSPFKKNEKTVWAWVGRGMSTNLHSRKRRRSNTPVVVISRSHTGNTKEIVENALGTDVPIIPAGGAGYKILQVMSGNATAYIHTTAIKKWDICAGNALIKSAGGRMTTIDGKDIDYFDTNNVVNFDGILASTLNHDWYFNKLKLYKNSHHF